MPWIIKQSLFPLILFVECTWSVIVLIKLPAQQTHSTHVINVWSAFVVLSSHRRDNSWREKVKYHSEIKSVRWHRNGEQTEVCFFSHDSIFFLEPYSYITAVQIAKTFHLPFSQLWYSHLLLSFLLHTSLDKFTSFGAMDKTQQVSGLPGREQDYVKIQLDRRIFVLHTYIVVFINIYWIIFYHCIFSFSSFMCFCHVYN